MADKSVVTSERFQQGIKYDDYISQINVNKDRFQLNYDTAGNAMEAEDVKFFKDTVENPQGAARVLVVGEDWCPDVYRGMPVIARIAEASGMDMRVFPRDSHLDIMDEFLKDGQHQSIPAVVFYTADHEYICHWIERPAIANKETAEITEKIELDMAGEDEQTVRRARRDQINSKYPEWQKATVKELRALISSASKQ
jgi:thiol-disulfide isomerase/thioredoxin